jgi:hypothetical protein
MFFTFCQIPLAQVIDLMGLLPVNAYLPRARRVAVSAMRALMSLRTSATGSGLLASKWSADFVRLYAATSDDSVESVVPLNGKYEHPLAVARKPATTRPL